jgi:hypothetical protein
MSTIAFTRVSSTTRPCENEISAGVRSHVYFRWVRSSVNAPSPFFGIASSIAERSPPLVTAMCATMREGVGSATSAPGLAGGRGG